MSTPKIISEFKSLRYETKLVITALVVLPLIFLVVLGPTLWGISHENRSTGPGRAPVGSYPPGQGPGNGNGQGRGTGLALTPMEVELPDGRTVICVVSDRNDVTCDWDHPVS